ncbi:hypothetical protein B0H12DRAFT_1148142 [Mycena haematopus]|nr:hypothetical protein B0H12DRAFT_1148142 [Mycena haematopus]
MFVKTRVIAILQFSRHSFPQVHPRRLLRNSRLLKISCSSPQSWQDILSRIFFSTLIKPLCQVFHPHHSNVIPGRRRWAHQGFVGRSCNCFLVGMLIFSRPRSCILSVHHVDDCR